MILSSPYAGIAMERKVEPRYHDGQKYVLLAEMPDQQARMFLEWVANSSYLPDPAQSKNNSQLVRYEDYEYWYNMYYLTEKDLDTFL